jgi:hypothetical protein
MALESRLKKLEQSLTPPGTIICITQYSCMDERATQAEVRRQLGREPRDGDCIMVVMLAWYGVECPNGPHSHAKG